MSTTIFDELTDELRYSPLSEHFWPPEEWAEFPKPCPICDRIDAHRVPVEQYHDPICVDCWQCNRHLAPEQWHCIACGKFLEALDRCVMWILNRPMFLCGKHYLEANEASE